MQGPIGLFTNELPSRSWSQHRWRQHMNRSNLSGVGEHCM